jgi:hypothetical protein
MACVLLFGLGSMLGTGALSAVIAVPLAVSARWLTWANRGLQGPVGWRRLRWGGDGVGGGVAWVDVIPSDSKQLRLAKTVISWPSNGSG